MRTQSSQILDWIIELYAYGCPVLMIIGTTGNLLLVIVVRCFKELQKNIVSSLHILTLAIMDTFVMDLGLLPEMLFCNYDIHTLHTSTTCTYSTWP